MMHALALGLGRGSAAPWTPQRLGGALLALWDAERPDLITQSGGAVSSWKDTVAGFEVVQATGASQPTYGATSFNGRPGLSFDGTDDYLRMEATPFPVGAAGCEMWALFDQQTPVADAGLKRIVHYGGVGNSVSRQMLRSVNSGVNRANAISGDGAGNISIINAAIDFTGRHVVRVVIDGAAAKVDVDGSAGSPTAHVPATTAVRLSICSANGTSPASLPIGVASAIAITSPLSDAQAAAFTAYLSRRL